MNSIDQERAFSDKIDCKFPYLDTSKATALVAEALSISPNAAFCVLYEILAPPHSEKVPKQRQRELLATWSELASFPLAVPISNMASHVIDGREVSTKQALNLMREAAAIQGQYAALTVISHLAYAGNENLDCDAVDTLEREIRMRWDASI
ncbi:hypothetical protein MRBLMR1_003259 [Neorhizobium sp. LMR1-1-1.1]|jgi:hypothetical protein